MEDGNRKTRGEIFNGGGSVAKAERRRFTAEYKLKFCGKRRTVSGQERSGRLLRERVCIGPNLTHWRNQRERGELAGLTAREEAPHQERTR